MYKCYYLYRLFASVHCSKKIFELCVCRLIVGCVLLHASTLNYFALYDPANRHVRCVGLTMYLSGFGMQVHNLPVANNMDATCRTLGTLCGIFKML